MNDQLQRYLTDVWECNTIADLSPVEAYFILENALTTTDPDHPTGYPDDQGIWNLYAEMHNLPTWDKITLDTYSKSDHHQGYLDNPRARTQNACLFTSFESVTKIDNDIVQFTGVVFPRAIGPVKAGRHDLLLLNLGGMATVHDGDDVEGITLDVNFTGRLAAVQLTIGP